jgi:hypothetical protein
MSEPSPSGDATTPPAPAGRPAPGLLWLAGVTAFFGILFQFDRDFPPINWAFGRPRRVAHNLGGLFIAAVFVLFVPAVRRIRTLAPRYQIPAVMLLGLAVCWSLALSDRRGAGTFTHEVWDIGHSEFLRIAMYQDLEGLAAGYEEMARSRNWRFPRSKPPGAILAYRAAVIAADSPLGTLLGPRDRPDDSAQVRDAHRQRRVARTVALLLPLGAFLTLLPLWFLARALVDPLTAGIALLLYAMTPTVLVGVVHLDGALYPLLTCSAAALVLQGWRRGDLRLLGAGGAVLSLGLYCSFSIAGAAPLIAGWPLIAAAGAGDRRRLGRALLDTAAVAAGLLLVHGILIFGMGYDPRPRYLDAIEFHKHWWGGGGRNWYIGSPLQFFLWIGVPFAVAFWRQLAGALRANWRAPLALYSLAAVLLLAVLTWKGHTRAEAQRLWMFWIPLLSVPAALTIRDWESRWGQHTLVTILLLEIATTFYIKSSYIF